MNLSGHSSNGFGIRLFALLLILTSSCSDSATNNDQLNDQNPENQTPNSVNIYFTDSNFYVGDGVTEYALGDSVYLKAIESQNLRPTYSPVWIYSHWKNDKEVFLMNTGGRVPHAQFPEDNIVGIAVRPPEATTTVASPFNGVIEVFADYDSLTAHYYSQTQGKLVTVGVMIIEGGK